MKAKLTLKHGTRILGTITLDLDGTPLKPRDLLTLEMAINAHSLIRAHVTSVDDRMEMDSAGFPGIDQP